MKYKMHKFYWANISLEMWGPPFETKHESELRCGSMFVTPAARSLCPSASAQQWLDLRLPLWKVPEVNVKRQITFHCPQKTECPICCLWLIHELCPMQKPKLAWTCSQWKKVNTGGKYLNCRTCTSISWTSRINSVGFKPFSHVAEMLDLQTFTHKAERRGGTTVTINYTCFLLILRHFKVLMA